MDVTFDVVTSLLRFPGAQELLWGVVIFTPVFMALRVALALRQGRSARDEIKPLKLIWSVSNNTVLLIMNGVIWAGLLAGAYASLRSVKPLIPWRLPPAEESWMMGWPLGLKIVIAVILVDFAAYWAHRLLHKSWAWPLHALHHSDRCLNFATTYRVHAFESLFRTGVTIVLLSWLNLPAYLLAYAGLIIRLYSFYLHSDLPIRHGRLEFLLASPNFHRWHHADVPEAYGKNLCLISPLWDRLFGTYFDPGLCRSEVGVRDLPDDIIRGQIYPFRIAGRHLVRMIRRDHPSVQDKARSLS